MMKKLLRGITSGPIALLLATCLVNCNCTSHEYSVYLVEKEFIGPVIILFDAVDGAASEQDSVGKEIYRIPASGVLETSRAAVLRSEGHSFYTIDKSGNTEAIEYLYPKGWEDVGQTFDSQAVVPERIYACCAEMGTTPVNKPNFRRFRTFAIGHPSQLDSLSRVKDQLMFSVVN